MLCEDCSMRVEERLMIVILRIESIIKTSTAFPIILVLGIGRLRLTGNRKGDSSKYMYQGVSKSAKTRPEPKPPPKPVYTAVTMHHSCLITIFISSTTSQHSHCPTPHKQAYIGYSHKHSPVARSGELDPRCRNLQHCPRIVCRHPAKRCSNGKH